jgi:tetratricopeptide (TPR) repeat protein
LSSSETFQLLAHWSKILNRPQIKDFINKFPGKVENVRLLTDGLPRTMQLFMEIVLQNEKSVDIDFLQKIMDEATPQYQERLINETPPMRKILLEMAFIWEACSTKQLAEKCKMTSKLVSANLKTLAARNLVDLITTDKRYHLYRISERFFNMWLIVTQGNPEQKRKARWVSIFLENWYDACELQELAKQHISRLKENKLSYKEAIILSKGLSLSKSISTFDRDKMIELTEAIADKKENYLMELPETFKKIKERINNYVDKGNLKKAHELANSIENEEDGWKYNIKGNIYATETSYKEAEKYYLSAIEKDDNDALFNLALLYFNQGKNELAEKYYLLAIENGNNKALNNLALLYISQGKYEVAEKYYLLAIEKEINEALWNLSGMYYVQNRKKEEVKQYLHKYKGNNTFLIIIEIWLGIFNDVENRVTAAFKENTDNQSDLIERLLIHHQKTLVNKLFEHAEFGNKLQEQYKPLYYVCRILNGKADENNLMLRIPPELDSTVKAILNRIEELQKFYE